MMDDEGPRPHRPRVVAHALGTWDVDELQDYVRELRAEIERAEAAIGRKTGHRQAAEAFFRLPGEPS